MDRTKTLLPVLSGGLDLDLDDPRRDLGETALALASRNAFPIVASRTARKDGVGLAAGGAVALLLGGLTFYSMSGSRTPPAPAAIVRPAAPSPEAGPLPVPSAPLAAPAPLAPIAAAPMVAPSMAPVVDHAHSPVVVYDVPPPAAMPASVGPVAGATKAPAAAPAQPLGDNEAFAQRIGGSEVETASATRMADPGNTISQGTLIAAVLETAIDSDLPGYVRAVVSQDVKSFDGRNVLIPRSSRLIGQYKSGLAAGQTRAYVMWTRLIRPDGVSVAIASPSIDYAGRSGLGGKVDGHFMKRFGSAMLLTVLGGASAIGGSGASVVLSSGGTSAAGIAAQRDAQIPPTIRVRQGEPIRIFTARDLDFSTVGREGGGE